MIQQTPSGNKLTGFYRGQVLKHLSNGFCKIYIPGVYPQEWNTTAAADNLPSAEQAAPMCFGTNDGLGIFSYPRIGSTVWCFFANGDQNLPVYFASTLGGEEAAKCFGEARSNVTDDNILNGEDAYVHKIDVNRTTIKIWESGYMEIVTNKDDAGTDNCKVTLDGKGNIIISSTQQIQVTAPNIKMTAADSMQLAAPTVKITAGSQLDVTTPVYQNINGVSHNIIAPSINLDATTGAVAIKGKKHTAFFN